jgi:dTDP-4-dehydrorhamnose 3,5-epimerase
VIFTYKCDNVYQKNAEGGIRFDDPSLQIDWKIGLNQAILSEKDIALPFLGAHKK